MVTGDNGSTFHGWEAAPLNFQDVENVYKSGTKRRITLMSRTIHVAGSLNPQYGTTNSDVIVEINYNNGTYTFDSIISIV